MEARRRIPLLLEPFGVHAIEYQAAALGISPNDFLARAAHYHLGIEREPGAPSFLGEPPAEWPRALTVALEPSCWAALETEAVAQGITVPQLLARASLKLAADLDSGRAVARIVAGGKRVEAA
jgi:hypothetical protein